MHILCMKSKRHNNETENEMLRKFNDSELARSYSARTIKASAIIMGDDGRYWVVTLAEMERLVKCGYEIIK